LVDNPSDFAETALKKVLMDDKRRSPKLPLLVKAHADGFIELFGDCRQFDIHCVNVPHISSDPGHEAKCDEYLDLVLPPRFRQLNWPGSLVASHVLTIVRPSDLHYREIELLIVQEAARRRAERRHEMLERTSRRHNPPLVDINTTTDGMEVPK
jgi:hypothetical protein